MTNRALPFRLQNVNAFQKTFPKVLEQGTVDSLQRVLVGSIDADVELSNGNERLHLLGELQMNVAHK